MHMRQTGPSVPDAVLQPDLHDRRLAGPATRMPSQIATAHPEADMHAGLNPKLLVYLWCACRV
jgi:hypothetical protein